jgi:nucleotide-binding universal stress UspA family protein
MGARPDGPLLICYDGSEDAAHAIEGAAALLAPRDALVLTVWQPTEYVGSFAWSGMASSMVDFVELDRAAAEDGERVAGAGADIARDAGFEAQPLAIKATGPVWMTILEIADRHDVAAIVTGSRGLTGLRSMLLGSVSSAVVHHANRPALVMHHPNGGG